MTPRERKRVAGVLSAQGKSPAEIAAHLKVTERSLLRYADDPIYQGAYHEERTKIETESRFDVVEAMRELLPKAVETYRELLEADNPSVQLGASNAVLDRFVPKQSLRKIEKTTKRLDLSADVTALIEARLKAAQEED